MLKLVQFACRCSMSFAYCLHRPEMFDVVCILFSPVASGIPSDPGRSQDAAPKTLEEDEPEGAPT